jgi:hypothetical protein
MGQPSDRPEVEGSPTAVDHTGFRVVHRTHQSVLHHTGLQKCSNPIGSVSQLFPNLWPMLLQVLRQFFDGHPAHSRTPFVGLDSL